MSFVLRAAVVAASIACSASGVLAQGGPPAGMSGGMPGMGMGAAVEVGYVEMQPQAVPVTATLPGRVLASASAQIRPQVGGIITSVEVNPGQPVKAGDLLFTIDDQTASAEVAAAQASVVGAEAQVSSAQDKVGRYETLAESNNVSQVELATARVELAQAQATLQSAQAQLQAKQISLKQTRIITPIDGIAGTVNAELGSLVTAGQADALATIRTIDPVYVALVESSANIASLRPSGPATEDTPPPMPTVQLTLEDGTVYDQQGTLSSADLVVSETTGTVTLRATIDNPNMILLPGMFVRAHVAIGEQENVFLVPQRAVTFNSRSEPTAYFVTADNTVEQRVLTATRDMYNAWVVTSGITAGDKLVVDGLQKISDGAAVQPLLVEISENGVVYQDMSTSADPSGATPTMPDGQTPPAGMSAPPAGTSSPDGMSAPAAGAPAPSEGAGN